MSEVLTKGKLAKKLLPSWLQRLLKKKQRIINHR